MTDDRNLPGSPDKRLISSVKKRLKEYGIVPGAGQANVWRMTWGWASFMASLAKPRKVWPAADLVAGMYCRLAVVDLMDRMVPHVPRLMDKAMMTEEVRLVFAPPEADDVERPALPPGPVEAEIVES